jgi:hypothetical protein
MTPKVEIDNSIYISSVKVPDEICNKCIELFEHRIENRPSEIFSSGEAKYHSLDRKDKSTYIDRNSQYNFDIVKDFGDIDLHNDLTHYLNASVLEYYEIFASLKHTSVRSTRMKLQRTEKGGGYHFFHFEAMDQPTSDRVLVWTIYLNDIEDGGETEFLYQSKRVKAKKGDICIFPANFLYTHRGNPPLSGTKYIVTGWYSLYE